MTKIYLSEAELSTVDDTDQVMSFQAYTLRGPMPQVFLVTIDRNGVGRSESQRYVGAEAVSVRTATMGPLTWTPYTKTVNVPLDDAKIVDSLSEPGAQCVLALPSREQLRQLTICSQRLPRGISEAVVARFKMCRSQVIDVPGIDDCPVNFECVVEHLETYHTHLIAFVRVVGASIDDAMLFRERQEIVSLYPTNFADEFVDQDGNRRQRVSLLTDLLLCPTFPVGPKQGWYGTFDIWMKDLMDEGYLSEDECRQAIEWHEHWQEVFPRTGSPERARLQAALTELARLAARGRWSELHAFLANTQPVQ